MAKIDDYNLQQPNTTGTDVQANLKTVVQPQAYNYAQTGVSTKATQPTQPTQQTASTTIKPTTVDTGATQNSVQNNQYVPAQNDVVARIPSDFTDNTVQGYINAYQRGVNANDYQAQINALTALDQYRIDNGYAPIYNNTILELNNKRNIKIDKNINDLDSQIAAAYNSGDYELAQQLGQQLLDYKKMTNYDDTRDRYDPRDAANYIRNNEYRSNYDSIINGIVSELLTARFTYNPAEDEALIKAQQYAANTVYESMNARGILNSSMTAQIVTATIANLQPTYEKMAREEFYENLNRLQTMASFVIDLDDRQYKRWVENTERNLQYYSILKDEVDYYWDRVNQMGYADNRASIVLGIAPGTLSASTRQAIQATKQKTQEEYDKLMTDIALAEAKAQLDVDTYAQKQAIEAQYDVDTYAQKQAIETGNYATKQAVAAQYKTTGSTKTSTSSKSSTSTNTSNKTNEYNRTLNATSVKKMLDNMKRENKNISEDDLVWAAWKEAKDDNAFVQGISGGDYFEGTTLEKAREIVRRMQDKEARADYYNSIEEIEDYIRDNKLGYTDADIRKKIEIIGDTAAKYSLNDDDIGELLEYFDIKL